MEPHEARGVVHESKARSVEPGILVTHPRSFQITHWIISDRVYPWMIVQTRTGSHTLE